MNSSITNMMQSLKRGVVDPVYLFQGNDKFLQKFLSEKIADTFFESNKHDKNMLIPDDMKGDDIINSITETDLFSTKKMFVLLEPQKLKGVIRNEFLSYCDNPVQSNCLVIIVEEYGNKNAMVKELTQRFNAINVSSPFVYDMKKWTQYFLKQNRIDAKNSIIDKITEMAGDSVGHIANEIDKISILLDGDRELTEELVDKFSGWKREHQRWEFFKALGTKDLQNSLKIGLTLLNQNENMVSLLYPLTAFFQEMLFTKMSPKTPPSKGVYIPLSASVKKNLPNYLKNYTLDEIELALKLLGEIDLKSKTTATSDDLEMTKFLFNLLGNNGK